MAFMKIIILGDLNSGTFQGFGKICFKTKNVDNGKRTNGSESERFEIQTFIKLNSIMKKT
jgi:hypothetical protein